MTGVLTVTAQGTHRSPADVLELVEDLLSSHDPTATDPASFWGAQFDRGLARVDFPTGAGGLDVDPALQVVVDGRLRAAGAPRIEPLNLIGVAMMAPTLIQFGTAEQQARFLRPAFTGEELWCQLFSEPGAGSDLASLSTRADRQGDGWSITGQKVWTTLAHRAQFGLLLARTDRRVPKHAGLTYFIVDMRAAGVEVRPLRQITGDAEYNEVFLTEVVVPDSQRLGAPGEGWRVAMATLMNERFAAGPGIGTVRGSGPIGRALRLWSALPPSDRSPVQRDRLARLWIEAEILRLTVARAEDNRRRGYAGPEGSIAKHGLGLLGRAVADFCMEVRGPAAGLIDDYELVQPTHFSHTGSESDDDEDTTKLFLRAQSLTIAGGTSEINRNLLGERVLGLPPEPKPPRLPTTQETA